MICNLSPQQLQELAQHVVAICSILELQLPVAQAPADVYPSATKAELAAAAGTTTRTLNRWLTKHQSKLGELGVSPKAKILPPVVVKYICEVLDIEKSALQR